MPEQADCVPLPPLPVFRWEKELQFLVSQSYRSEAEILCFGPGTDQIADSGRLSTFSAGSFTPVWLLLSWGLRLSDQMIQHTE